MNTLQRISSRVSIVEDFGRVNVRVERSACYAVMIGCGAADVASSIETAHRVARREAWKIDLEEWQKRARNAVMEAGKATCNACAYRNGAGCLSDKCPVFRLLDSVNRAPALVKRTAKAL